MLLSAAFALMAGVFSGCMSLMARSNASKNEGNISPQLYPSLKGYEVMGSQGGLGLIPVMIVMAPFDFVFDTAMLTVDLPYYGKRKWDESFWQSVLAENDLSQSEATYSFHLSHAGKESCLKLISWDMQANGQGERTARGKDFYYEFKTPQNCRISTEMLDVLFKTGISALPLSVHPNASSQIKTAAKQELTIMSK
jgi:uncharacterized protein YceK